MKREAAIHYALQLEKKGWKRPALVRRKDKSFAVYAWTPESRLMYWDSQNQDGPNECIIRNDNVQKHKVALKLKLKVKD